ncbi:MAG: hypothetical protein IJM59_10115 [Proteobacteria bacterium]|nr:hypothetical protein [Pseudomonadota bacterium]
MNIQKLITIHIVMFTAAVSGCNLDDPVDYGEDCPGVVYIQEGAFRCSRDNCVRNGYFFEQEKCPESQPYCIMIPGEDVYCSSECPKRTHKVENTADEDGEKKAGDKEWHFCEADTVEHCGDLRENCTSAGGWMQGECTADKKCEATTCTDTYRLDKGVCKLYSMCCGKYCAHCRDVRSDKTGNTWFCSGVGANAECIETCMPPMVNCDGLCIDPASDDYFCGADDKCKKYEKCGKGLGCYDGKCLGPD